MDMVSLQEGIEKFLGQLLWNMGKNISALNSHLCTFMIMKRFAQVDAGTVNRRIMPLEHRAKITLPGESLQ
jgi:hypothetical protein